MHQVCLTTASSSSPVAVHTLTPMGAAGEAEFTGCHCLSSAKLQQERHEQECQDRLCGKSSHHGHRWDGSLAHPPSRMAILSSCGALALGRHKQNNARLVTNSAVAAAQRSLAPRFALMVSPIFVLAVNQRHADHSVTKSLCFSQPRATVMSLHRTAARWITELPNAYAPHTQSLMCADSRRET